jgi:hypothetical protein
MGALQMLCANVKTFATSNEAMFFSGFLAEHDFPFVYGRLIDV